jgi:gamma-glutamylcyclotransferase (GGCT)/AIG2-like uncharacterized protein YtfP
MNREASMISSPLTGRDSLLFVYGTLRPFVDIPMAKWLRRAAHYVGPATMRGRLYDLKRYPGLHAPRSRRDCVVGDVSRREPTGIPHARSLRSPIRPQTLFRETRSRQPQGGMGLPLSLQRCQRLSHRERRLSRSPSRPELIAEFRRWSRIGDCRCVALPSFVTPCF